MPALFEWRERDRRYEIKKPKLSAHGRKLLAQAHAHPIDGKKGNEGFEDCEVQTTCWQGVRVGKLGGVLPNGRPRGDAAAPLK